MLPHSPIQRSGLSSRWCRHTSTLLSPTSHAQRCLTSTGSPHCLWPIPVLVGAARSCPIAACSRQLPSHSRLTLQLHSQHSSHSRPRWMPLSDVLPWQMFQCLVRQSSPLHPGSSLEMTMPCSSSSSMRSMLLTWSCCHDDAAACWSRTVHSRMLPPQSHSCSQCLVHSRE